MPLLQNHLMQFQMYILVSFILYFHLLVFGILVTLVAWFLFQFFFHLAHLALQNVNKDYIIFLYFRNFVAKSDQKRKMGWTKHLIDKLVYKAIWRNSVRNMFCNCWYPFFTELNHCGGALFGQWLLHILYWCVGLHDLCQKQS